MGHDQDPLSPASIFLDFAAFWMNKLASLLVAGVLFLVAFLTNFSIPVGVSAFFLGIAVLAWNIKSARIYVLVGVVIMALSMGLLDSALGVDDSSNSKQKQTAAKTSDHRPAGNSNQAGQHKTAANTKGQQSAKGDSAHQQGKGSNKGAKTGNSKAAPSAFGAVKSYLGILIFFAIVLGAFVFMGRGALRESKGFLTGKDSR